ncbi:hypothetical protein [Paraburkholderia sp. 2C]
MNKQSGTALIETVPRARSSIGLEHETAGASARDGYVKLGAELDYTLVKTVAFD